MASDRTTLSVIVAVCAASFASCALADIIFTEPWDDAVIFHLTNRDSGTNYGGPAGTYGPLGGQLPFPPPTRVPGPGALPGEDTWGVFKVDSIQKAMVIGPNQIVGRSGNLWTDADGGSELVGVFWGLNDIAVQINPSGGQTVEGQNLKFAIFEQTFGVYDDGLAGSAGRVGPAVYTSVGTDASSQLWLTGMSVPGFVGSLVPGGAEFVASFDPNVPIGSAAGSAACFLSIAPVDVDGDLVPDTGLMNAALNSNFYQGNAAGGPITADLAFQITTYLNNPSNAPGIKNGFDWTVTSSDPVAGIIPEPASLVLLVMGGLALICRKRRLA